MSTDEIAEWLGVFFGADGHERACSDVDSAPAREQVRARLLDLADEPAAFRKAVWPFVVRNGPEGPFGLEDMQQALRWLAEFLGWDDLADL